MPIKKINGYKIFLGEELGRGAYGAVLIAIFRFTRDSRIVPSFPVPSKLLIRKTVRMCLIAVNSDPYLKSALFSEIQILGKLKSENIVRLFDVM